MRFPMLKGTRVSLLQLLQFSAFQSFSPKAVSRHVANVFSKFGFLSARFVVCLSGDRAEILRLSLRVASSSDTCSSVSFPLL